MVIHMDLEMLIGFLGKKDSIEIANKIRKRDKSVGSRLAQIAASAYDYYWAREEDYGPQEIAHLGILYEQFGDYFAEIGGDALEYYRTAWSSYMSARGHDVDADDLVKRVPELKAFSDVKNAKY